MDRTKDIFKKSLLSNNENEIINLLSNGFDANFEGGWPLRLAARNGHYSIVKLLIEHGASPHLLNEAGASTLQLAVYSSVHWDSSKWTFLLSCFDSSQLADGAAVAIIFNNIPALQKILETGRCNTNIPTTLTGKTVEDLAKGYKLQYLLHPHQTATNPVIREEFVTFQSPHRTSEPNRSREVTRDVPTTSQPHRNLSPSVARFFDLTAAQPSLTPPHSPLGQMFSSTR